MRQDVWTFLRGELVSWAFWKFWGLPIVGTAISIAVGLVTGQSGYWIVLGTVGCFSVACIGSAALAYREHLKWLRSSGGVQRELEPRFALPIPGPLPFRKREAEPIVTVEPHGGEEGFLLLVNAGGGGVFSATGQIVAVVAIRKNLTIKHTAPFKMRWRDTTTHAIVKGHKHVIPANGSARLLLAFMKHQSMGSSRGIVIYGDAIEVDSYWVRYPGESTPMIFIDVEITSEPSLLRPFKERFAVQQPSESPIVVRGEPA